MSRRVSALLGAAAHCRPFIQVLQGGATSYRSPVTMMQVGVAQRAVCLEDSVLKQKLSFCLAPELV